MNYNPTEFKYPSRRNVMYANRGMVATSQPLASQAGLEILKKGGNAIDAAIATAACLTVVEPTSNGLGSDAFALVWTKDKLHGLNASGYSPYDISIEKLKKRGYTEIPKYGVIPVMVPGAPAAWVELSSKFGKLPLSEVLEPAINYARNGFTVSTTVKRFWDEAYDTYKKEDGEEFKYWFDTFTKDGRTPRNGELWKLPYHADTLESIGKTKGESFYKGEIGDKIDAFFKKYNGYLSKKDLMDYKPEWVEPINVNYRGYDVWEIPPNGQGLVALMALNILKGFEFDKKEIGDTYHKQMEAMKLAFADGIKYITDKSKMKVEVSKLLSNEYGQKRKSLITEEALSPEAGDPNCGGTVYLCTADEEGNMVSYIQSNYLGFGSGIVIPETGIALQNRGNNFSFDLNHDNCLLPHKKTYHTIIPGFLTKDGKAVGPFGVMGAFMQPQGHVQVVMNILDFDMNPQEALDAPRWMWTKDKTFEVEKGVPTYIVNDLIKRGHDIKIQTDEYPFGRGQIILRTEEGTYCGGTEHRADGHIAVW
ncbi:gamma-glutamyltransferase family protein [Sedimentibacter sp. MB31-C6]|uniref:gamma-glutamyltransferase family protein n=1 Tax=Sedimentibacter sp. MB31-C6 TaxID=3109366 RepID=UPI002DDCFBA0|nr:gamma-glutamyltransferase family protein [Sedimentibacter sp. MB36-C1]WSI05370.1 gamma-glutamyltransferase family protein [Sedimentibacter sp. MB36-C1]